MTITSNDVNLFIQTFPETTQRLVTKFWVKEQKSELCKKIVTSILNKGGYNSSPIKGDFETTDTLYTLYETIIVHVKSPSFWTRIIDGLFGNILVRMLCHLLELEYVVVKNNPEKEKEIVQAMILTGLKAIFQGD